MLRYFFSRNGLFLAALFCSATTFAQVVGGRGNGQSTPSEVKASELSKGAYSADVNLFSGTFNSSYNFGSVSTPSGLGYSLSMDYASSYSGGDNVPVVSGVPYGEGWSLSVPSIRISTEAYNKYTESQLISLGVSHSDTAVVRFTEIDALREGKLFYFAPVISIPGVINERFVYKYHDVNNMEDVFVPAKFETYVEARFSGTSWSVRLSDGTVYFFGLAQTAARNASNQRVYKDATDSVDISQSNHVLKNLVMPKNEVLAWYCTSINNPNHPAGQQILFQYEKFGHFNYFKEYFQPHMLATLQQHFDSTLMGWANWYNGTSTIAENGLLDFTTYKDIVLKCVAAVSWDVTIEKIDLDYKTLFTSGTNDLMLPNQPGVSRLDSLYNYKTVHSWGIEGGQNPESSVMGSATSGSNFSNWSRYYHSKASGARAMNSNQVTTMGSPVNPYIGLNGGEDPSNLPHYFKESVSSGNNVAFSHAFIESPRIGSTLPPGDTYELKALVVNTNSSSAGERFCNFDINICSGSDPSAGYSYYNSDTRFPVAKHWDVARSSPVYSTFNQAIKWNSMATDPNANYNQYTVMRAVFALPNLPNEFNGFSIQIGAGNSDHEFSVDSTLVGPTPVSSFRAYYNQRYHTPYFNPNVSGDVEPCDAITQNFGIGMPWHAYRKLYATLDDGDNTYSADRYNFWWNDNQGSGSFPNKPTRADENVNLAGVELIRYSKNPYMLSGVKHYKTNGDAATPILVSEYRLEYDLQFDSIINNRIYTGSQPKTYKGLRNIYLLKRVRQLPTNPSVPATPPSYTLTDVPTTHFEYTKLFNTFVQDTIRTNANIWALTKYTDQLGGEVAVAYYPLSDSRTTVVDRYIYKNLLAEPFNPLASVQKAPSRAIQLSVIVKSKTVTGESGQSFAKTWDYDFQTKVNQIVQPTLPVQFRPSMIEVEHGFASVTVQQPQLQTSIARAKSKQYHHQSTIFWGKLYRSETYDENNLLNEFQGIDYDSTEAYGNAMYRTTINHDVINDLSDYPGLSAPASGYDLSQQWAQCDFVNNPLQCLEVVNPACFPAAYMTSYFVKTAKDHTTSYEYNPLAPINSNSGYNSGDTLTSAPEQKNWYSITSVNEYSYWEADKYGTTTSQGFKKLLGSFTGSSYTLSFEPSWQLYRAKTTSPQQQDAYAQNEHFHYYDLKNFYLDVPYTFDAVHVAHQQGIRGMAYEERITGKAANLAPVMNSKYFWYDFKWNQNAGSYIPTTNDTIDGPLTCPGFTPDTIQNNCIKYYGQPAPIGYVLTADSVTGELRYCPGSGTQTHAPIIITGPDEPPPPAPNVGYWLAGKLFFRQEVTAVDSVIVNTSYTNTQNAGILRFAETTTTPLTYYPVYPFDTIGVYTVKERNELGQVQMEHNERGLCTKYYYKNPYRVWHVDLNDPCNSYLSTFFHDIGLPAAVTAGYGDMDSLHSSFLYFPNNSVQRITDPNGLQSEYLYDIFGRMREMKADNKKRTQITYHQWANNLSQTFSQRAAENYISTHILNNDSSNVAEHRYSYLDPLGRVYVNASQVSPNYTTNALDSVTLYSGQVNYDNWSRGIENYKPFKYNDPNSSTTTMAPLLNTTAPGAPQATETNKLELNMRGRLLKAANFGQTLNSNYTLGKLYTIITATQLSQELNLTASEFLNITGVSSSANNSLLRFRKHSITDQDGKRIIEYSNGFGQKIGVKQYIDQTVYASTLFAYNSQGKTRLVINPEKQQTSYKYNLFGWVYEKQTVDNGITRYMYDGSGKVILEQDANLRGGWDHGYDPGEGQCHGCEQDIQRLRYYEYDKFGRIIKQSRIQWTTLNPLLYVNIDPNITQGKRLTVSSATTIDRTYNLELQSGPNWYRPGVYGYLVIPGITEKKFKYHTAEGSTANSTTQTFLSTNPQQKLKGRLSSSVSYLHTGEPTQKRWYSYDSEGRVKYALTEFDETDLSSGSGRVDAIWYDSFNLRGSVKNQRVDAGVDGVTDITYNYVYDGYNRLAELKVNNEKIAAYQYFDELGLVKQVKYYTAGTCNAGAAEIDTLRYSYDVRDRLTQIKSILFEENLYYDSDHPQVSDTSYKVTASKNWNGNINATKVNYYMDRAVNYGNIGDIMDGSTYYGYTYDGLNRLTAADASVMNVLTANPSTPGNPARWYGDENLTYDKIGNILTLQRGLYYEPGNGSPANVVHDWRYYYVTGKNHLSRIDSVSTALKNYTYDFNGNIRTDSYRNVGSMSYSRANLPTILTANNEILNYSYDVADQRMFKHNSSTSKKEYYLTDAGGTTLGVYAISANTWNWYVSGQGRTLKISTNGQSTEKTYYISDHLGNTRVSYTPTLDCDAMTTTLDVSEALDYYPFGKTLRSYHGTDEEKYQFNGKERDGETEWDYFGARYYDGDVGRWLACDPLAEKFISENSFIYSGANPIYFLDEGGKEKITHFIMYDQSGNKIVDHKDIDPNYVKKVTKQGFIPGLAIPYTTTDEYDIEITYTVKMSVGQDGKVSYNIDAFYEEKYRPEWWEDASLEGKGHTQRSGLILHGDEDGSPTKIYGKHADEKIYIGDLLSAWGQMAKGLPGKSPAMMQNLSSDESLMEKIPNGVEAFTDVASQALNNAEKKDKPAQDSTTETWPNPSGTKDVVRYPKNCDTCKRRLVLKIGANGDTLYPKKGK